MNEPIAGALVKLTTESGKALMTLPARGKALVRSMPEPVQLGLETLSSRGAQVCREIFAGILVVGLIAIVLGYGRLARGPLSLPTLVPTIEASINDQLTDMRVKIDDAVLQRSSDGPGIVFRLRNIRLIDKDGSIIAQAPLAAIGMSGSALLRGRLAPGSVDFIGPRLLLFYNDEQGLSLTFSRPSAAETEAAIRGSITEGEGAATSPEPGTVIAKRPQSPIAGGGRKLDLTTAVNDVFDRARKGTTSSHLTRFGFKDALVALDQNGTQTLWQVPDFAIDLEHRDKRSIIVGQANLASSKGDWQLELRTEQHPKKGTLSVTALIQDLVPSGIAGNFPSIGIFRALDMAVDGEAKLELSNSGEYLAGDANFRLASGQITPPWDRDMPLRIDGGQLQVRYDAQGKGVIEILPSTLRWGESRATVSGTFSPVRAEDGTPASWDFRLKADDTVLAVEEHKLAPTKIDEWVAEGNLAPKDGQLTLSRFVIRSGTAQVALAGTVTESPEHPGSPEVKLAGEISPMPADTFKQFWPKFLAGKARAWVLERIAGGEVHGGKFNIALAAGDLTRIEQGADAPEGALTVELAASGLNIAYIPKAPPVATGESRLTVAGTELTIDVPQGTIALPSGHEIALTEGRFVIPDLRVDPQQGEIAFKATGATPAVLELLDHEPFQYLQAVGLKPDLLGGTTVGAFTLSMPLVADLEFNEIKLNGTARLENAITSDLMAGVAVEGGAFDVSVNEREVEARGEISIKGVPAELLWRRVFYTPDEQQPPATVTAILDDAAREKLGFKINHLVKGQTPVNLSISGLGRETQKLSLQADLTGARLLFGDMGWTKPAGRAATVDFDVVKHQDGAVDLANLRIVGDEIAIHGSVSLDPEHSLKGFHLSDLSINRFTHVEIAATVREDGVLEIRAQGPSFDGRQFFQSLFSPGQFVEASKDTGEAFAGVDFTAQIGTVAGLYDTKATDVQVSMKKRNGRLTALDSKGMLNGKSPATVRLEPSGNARLIKAESADAGSAFRLVGFYPSIEGGNAKLQVNLDAGAKGSISGTLWAHDFTVKGDSVVGDVLSDPSSEAVLGANRKQQRGTGQRIAFTQLRAPFTVGGGKFRLRDAYMNGPQLGATMRGTVDFKSDTVELGGTYVPLYGLNSALGSIPILGKVFVGRKGEGVVGITFAIKGKLDNPTVMVNPMSVMTPGIFRQLFEFTGSVPEGTAATTQAAPESGFGMPPP